MQYSPQPKNTVKVPRTAETKKANKQVEVGFIVLIQQIFDWRLWAAVFKTFINRQGQDAVSSLAYTSLVGIVPMLAVMLGIFSVSSYFDSFSDLVMEQVVGNLMPNSHPVIEEYIFKFSEQAANLKGPGIVVMLFTTLMLLWKVDQKINSMWSERLQRKWWVSLLHYLGVSLLGPVLLGLSIVVSSSLLALPFIVDTTPFLDKLFSGMQVLPLMLAWLGFTALYKLVPVAKVPFKIAFVAGLFAMLEVELLKYGFSLYVKWFPTYSLVYGAFAAVPLFLLWLYSLWMIVIWNGALVATLIRKNRRGSLAEAENEEQNQEEVEHLEKQLKQEEKEQELKL